ncbi:transglutaminase-like domain-containing protein [Mycoplasmopsis citelli]|uniref:transglutaminase-like domain-containing protein n=1 Tax=Mycoplasmopsis citelli TaxID=171281 RepID=UPI002115558E|nr:transglutaminase-like domain-containing protein [Mycoplasmopsis citelli]UUD36256.1 transglutaminase-like domain-containing protein [Mycoplasmopsis citelli]
MKFFKSKTKKFTLLLTSTFATTACVFLSPSLILHKTNNISYFLQDSGITVYPKPSEIPELRIKNLPKEELSYLQKTGLSGIKSNLQKIVLDSKKFPISEDFLSFVNDNIKQIEQEKDIVKDYDDYWNIKRIQRIFVFYNYKLWKQAFSNPDDLVLTSEDKDEWKKIFIQKSNEIKTLSEKKQTINSQNYLKDFYIYKLQEQIKLYEKYPYYFQPLERLKKILYYYQNNYEEYVDFQWGIDKNNKFSLDPSKYYSGNYQWIQINDEYIKNWLKYYQRWNWVFINKEDQIDKIEDKKIKALQINPKFKNNKIISDYMKRQINFAPDSYDKLWTTNPKYPEKVNINDIKNKNSTELFKKYKNTNIQTIDEINKLNLKFNNFQTTLNFEDKKINVENKEYEFQDNSQLKDFDYKKFWKYQNFLEPKDNRSIDFSNSFNIYNNLLWKQPNLFSDAHYRIFYSELINPVHRRTKENDHIVDYTTSLIKEEIKEGKIFWKEPHWINPIPEYKRWFNHWKEILPKIINKNWDDKTKIKAVAYYIATNSLYLFPIKKNFNYNGYGFYNPAQIFTNDPEIQCVGYSMNLAAALTILNIPVRILGGPVVGTPTATFAEGGHAWNEVFVDGRWKAIDLTNWDLNENTFDNKSAYELKDDEDLFLERNSEWMNQLKLDISSYQTTLMFFKNPKEYEYKDLPESI